MMIHSQQFIYIVNMYAVTVARSGIKLPTLLHKNVVEVKSSKPNYREFRCNDCGLTWREEITSATMVIEDKIMDEIEKYYPIYEYCK